MAAKNAEPNGFEKNCTLLNCNGLLKGIVQPCKITSLPTNIWVLVVEACQQIWITRYGKNNPERLYSRSGSTIPESLCDQVKNPPINSVRFEAVSKNNLFWLQKPDAFKSSYPIRGGRAL